MFAAIGLADRFVFIEFMGIFDDTATGRLLIAFILKNDPARPKYFAEDLRVLRNEQSAHFFDWRTLCIYSLGLCHCPDYRYQWRFYMNFNPYMGAHFSLFRISISMTKFLDLSVAAKAEKVSLYYDGHPQ